MGPHRTLHRTLQLLEYFKCFRFNYNALSFYQSIQFYHCYSEGPMRVRLDLISTGPLVDLVDLLLLSRQLTETKNEVLPTQTAKN